MPSPQFRINGGAVGVKASVSAGGAVSATLDSTDGVRSVSWSIIGTDETTTAGSYTLVQSGSVGQTVSFTAGAAGTAGILRAEINGGQNLQTEQADSTTRATAKWYVPTGSSGEVGCVNEGTESDPTYGWTGIVNYGVRGSAASAVPTGRTITAGAGLTGGGDLSTDRTFDVAANADGSIVVNANDVQVGILATDAQHGTRGGGTQHATATITANGFMPATDKAKVDAGWILTRAAVSAITTPADHTLSYCVEVDAHYRFSFGDSSTADSWTILTGDGGRWFLQGDRIAISPLGDSLDDAARVEEALAACAYKVFVELLPGHWIWETVCSVTSGASLRGSPEVHVDSSITPSGGAPTESAFYATPPAATMTTGLAVVADTGDITIELDDATGFIEGAEIAIIEDNQVSPHLITGVAGDILTLDTPVLAPFTTAAVVRDWVAPKDIRIVGNNMRITGTGDAAIELVGAVRAHVEGVRVEDCSFVAILINFDVGSRDCTLKHCVLDGCDVVINGWHFESAQNCYAEHVTTKRATQGGIFLPGGAGHTIVGCESVDCGTGAILTAALTTNGSRNVTFSGCRFNRNSAGVDIQSGSTNVTFSGCHAIDNAGAGFAVNGGTAASGDVHFSECISVGNQNGFVVVASSVGSTMSDCQANDCTDYGILCSGELLVDGFVSRECGSGGVSADSAAHLMLLNARLSRTANDDWNAIRQEGTARIDAAHLLINMAGTGTKIVVSSVSTGVIDLSHLRTVGGTFGIVTSTATVRRGPGVDVSSVGLSNELIISGTGEASVPCGMMNVRDTATIPGSSPASGVILYATGGLLSSHESGGQIVNLGNGGSWSITSVQTGTYAAAFGEFVRCDPSGGGFTVNLPTAVGASGRSIIIKNVTSSTNTITVDGNSGETIDGLATQPFTTAFGSYTLISDNANWMIA